MTSRTKKAGYTAAAVLGLFIGAAGIAAASTGGISEPSPTPASQTDEADDEGVNCEDGLDTATGLECDGGPAAALADEANEAPDTEDGEKADEGADDEADDGVDHQFEGEEVGENGDGIPDADDATETREDDG